MRSLVVSEKLCALPVDAFAHVPEIRALDWRRDSKRVVWIGCPGIATEEAERESLAAALQAKVHAQPQLQPQRQDLHSLIHI